MFGFLLVVFSFSQLSCFFHLFSETTFIDSLNEIESSEFQHQILDLELVADEVEARKLSNLSLVGKICCIKIININELYMILRRVWFTKEPIRIEQLRNNVFLFSFKNKQDRNRF